MDVPVQESTHQRRHLRRWNLNGQASDWTSPVVEEPWGVTHLVPSWDVRTPPGTWVEVAVRGHADDDRWSSWLPLAVWASDDATVRPTSHQRIDDGRACTAQDQVIVDAAQPWVAWQVRISGHQVAGPASPASHGSRPTLASISMSTARLDAAAARAAPTSAPASYAPVLIDVPPLSQQRHRRRLRQFNGGGATWCSPTCLTMLLAHWHALPDPAELDWLGPDYPDPAVAQVTRRVFDAFAGGTGNWSFNIAYAASRGVDAYVTRLADLRAVEAFVRGGIPVVCSVAFRADELAGAGYGTDGHLIVVVGFDAAGDVVVNDPAAHGGDARSHVSGGPADHGNDRVRTTYRRDQFEWVWQHASGGVVYIVGPPSQVSSAARAADADGTHCG